MLAAHPDIRAILLECTELPPYADALRHKTGLPVFDAITCCDFFMMGAQDNERFGLQGWIEEWDAASVKTLPSHWWVGAALPWPLVVFGGTPRDLVATPRGNMLVLLADAAMRTVPTAASRSGGIFQRAL